MHFFPCALNISARRSKPSAIVGCASSKNLRVLTWLNSLAIKPDWPRTTQRLPHLCQRPLASLRFPAFGRVCSKYARVICIAALLGTATSSRAAGESAVTSLAISGTVGGSLELAIDWNGSTGAAAPLGSVSKYSSPPEGWTKTAYSDFFEMSTTVGIKALIFNTNASDSYTLRARLASQLGSKQTWSIKVAEYTERALQTTELIVGGAVPFNTRKASMLRVTIGDDGASGSLNNIIYFTATAN